MAVGRKELRRQKQKPTTTTGRFQRRKQNGKPTPIDARQKLRKNLIVKSEPGVNNRVQIYTTHFDARNKINAKKRNSSSSQQQQQQQQQQSKPSPIVKKAVNDVRKGGTKPMKKSGALNKFQQVATNNNNNNNNNKKKAKRTNHNVTGVRETTFTGVSIKVSTTNDLAHKERKTLVKGKTLSVIAKNKTIKTNKQIHKTINNTWVGPSRLSSPQPSVASSSTSSSKKSIPAKVVISNLHPNVTQEDILELFGAIGALREGRLKSVGTAEVIYKVAEDAFAAYSKYHGRNLDGQPMILKITTAEESSSSSTSSSAMPSRSNKYSSTPTASSVPTCYSSPTTVSTSSSATSTSGTPVVFTVKL